jgi:ribosomal protein S18 acetylase RimI-like enzyme
LLEQAFNAGQGWVRNVPVKIPIRIRLMQDSDIFFIRRGISETNWQDIPEDQKAVLDKIKCDKLVFDDFERFLKNERFKFKVFIADSETDRQMGFISVGELTNPAVGLPFGAILDFWVAPEYRRKGVGGKLLDHALDYIRAQGYTHATILASSSNEKALSLYRKRGFYNDRVVLAKRLKWSRKNL